MKERLTDHKTNTNSVDDVRRQIVDGWPADEMFRVIVEATPNAIVLANAQGRILLLNAGAEKLFGYAREELIGQPVEMLLPERFRATLPGFREAYAAHPEARTMGKDSDLFVLRKDGSEVPVEIGLNPIETTEGPLILGAIIDISERKRAEEALRARSEDFRASFYSSAVGQAQVDPATGRYLRVNPKFCEIAGYSEDELLQMTFRELTHPDDRADDAAAHERMIRGEAIEISREKRYLRKDGRTVWVHINASFIRDQTGRPVRTLAVVRDVTAHKAAEEAHRAAEAKFRRLVEQSLVGIYVIQDDRFAYVNPKMEEIFGFSQEELAAAPVTDFIFEKDRPLVRENIRKRMAGETESIRYGLRMLRKDGEVIHVEARGGRTEYNGRPAILGTLLDTSERKRAEDAMRENQQLLRAIIDNSTAVVYVKDLEGRYLLVNRRFEQIFHLTSQVILGRTDHDFFPKEQADAFRTVDQRVVAAGIAQEIEELAPHDDGLHTYLSIKCPLFDAIGKPYAMCGISTDITERKRAEDEIGHRSSR